MGTMVECLLEEEFGVARRDAVTITEKFLISFRATQECSGVSLDEWRKTLWQHALGKDYQHLAGVVAEQWTEWRFELLRPDDGVCSMLHLLKSKYMLALITNGHSRTQWEKIQRLDMARFFQTILVSGELSWEKPSKAIFLAACEQMRVAPQNCIMIGDRLETDILGAQNAEFAATVWVPLEETRLNVDVVPDLVIEHVSHLPRILPPARPDLSRYINLSEPESENSNCSETS